MRSQKPSRASFATPKARAPWPSARSRKSSFMSRISGMTILFATAILFDEYAAHHLHNERAPSDGKGARPCHDETLGSVRESRGQGHGGRPLALEPASGRPVHLLRSRARFSYRAHPEH